MGVNSVGARLLTAPWHVLLSGGRGAKPVRDLLDRGGLGLKVVDLGSQRRLHLVDLGSRLVNRRGELQLVVDRGGDAVVGIEVGGGGGNGVKRALCLRQHVVLLVELERLAVHLRGGAAGRLRGATEAVAERGAIRE